MEASNWYKFNFCKGAISPTEMSDALVAQNKDTSSGAYSLFLGRVRADEVDGKEVESIEYTANEEMALSVLQQIASDAKENFSIHTLKIIHSLETVKTGELCLLVMISCAHRKESMKACEYVVERLKKEVPVWGKEILSDKTHSWKINKY